MKIAATLLFTLVFMVMNFPYDDLAEVVSSQVAERTNNQVSLQFDRLGMQLFPNPALAFYNVEVESSLLPSLQVGQLSLAPSVLGFLSFRPGFTAGAKDIWGGNVDLDVKSGKKTEQGSTQQLVTLELDRVDLSLLNEVTNVPLKFQGTIAGDLNLNVDPSFTDQPQGDVVIKIKELRFPAGTVPTQMGPVSIPGMSWNEIRVKGKLNGGKLQLEQLELGSTSDLLYGQLKGEIDLKVIQQGNGQIGVSWGAYNLTVDLSVNNRIEKDLGLFLGFLGSYKSTTSAGSRFKFRMFAQQFGSTPSISAN